MGGGGGGTRASVFIRINMVCLAFALVAGETNMAEEPPIC